MNKKKLLEKTGREEEKKGKQRYHGKKEYVSSLLQGDR